MLPALHQWHRDWHLLLAVATAAACLPASNEARAQAVFPIANNTATVIAGGSAGLTSDLFDLTNGCKVVSSSGMLPGSAFVAESMFGGKPGFFGETGNALFADGGGVGTSHYVLFELPSPVLLQSIRLELSQDGPLARRALSSYTLEGLTSPSGQGLVLSTAPLASNYQDAYGDANITVADTLSDPFVGRFFRLTVVQRDGFYGPRVKELDGFGLFEPIFTIDVASGTQTQRSAGYPRLTSGVGLVKQGDGTLVLDSPNDYTGRTTVSQGAIVVASGSAMTNSPVTVADGALLKISQGVAATVAGLTVSGSGMVDLTNGSLRVKAGLTPANVASALLQGRGDGSWNGGGGITSSVVAADVAAGTPRTIGWSAESDGSMTISYAAPGDGTLDGQVDILDAAYFIVSGKFNNGRAASWRDGDYNYDGMLDILDAADLISTGLFDAGPYGSGGGAAGIAMVPEPPALTLGLAGVVGGLAAWRSRRQPGSRETQHERG
jgi:autotransporter-associated beta strand protein